jgi:hypothetical protein
LRARKQDLFHAIATLAGPVLFSMGLLFLPNGIWRMGQRLAKNDAIQKLVKDTQADEISKISSQLLAGKKDDGSYLAAKIPAAINYAIGRHDWYEEQRSNIFKNTLTVGGMVLAAMGLYSGLETSPSDLAKLIILSAGLTILIGVGIIVHLYNVELDADRPYRLVSDVRHWFFRYALPGKASRTGSGLNLDNLASRELVERTKYVDALIENSSLANSLREDLEQLFILHVLQRYKHESLQKMRWTFSWLMLCLFVEAVWYYGLVQLH